MDWTMPDRPRRLVTYGKSTHNRTDRKQRVQAVQVSEDKNSNGLMTKYAEIDTPTGSDKGRLTSFRESFGDAITKETSFVGSHDLGVPSRLSNRSPKRRKLSPKGEDRISPISSPRSRTRHGASTQTTYARNIPDAKRRLNTRPSLSPGRSADHAVSSSDRGSPPHQTTASHIVGTPSRRRLVDSLRALDDESNSSHSDSDSSRKLSEVAAFRQSTPVTSDFRNPQGYISQMGQKLHHKTSEAAENVVPPQLASPKITYSRQRSFLRSVDFPGDPSRDAADDLFPLPIQSTSVDNTEVDQIENSRTVRSIHELRRAGVNARFQGLVDCIFEDIEDRSSSASVRRKGFIQLCEKLLDEKFTQRFVEIGAFERLKKCMPGRGDLATVLLSVYACALVLQLNHLPPTIYTGAWSKLIAASSTLLPLDDSIPKFVAQRRLGLSRINQESVRDICVQFCRLSDLDERECLRLSPRRLILLSLHSTIPKVREKDIAETIPVEVVSKLVDILLELGQQITDRDAASDDSNCVFFESIISILETYTTTSDITGKAQQDALVPLTNFSHLLVSLSNRIDPQDIQLLTLHIRLILNITNASPSLCEKFATAQLIDGLTVIVLSNYPAASDEFDDEKKDSLDIIILALGALINLAEVSEAARRTIIKQKKGPQSLLKQLVSIFTRGLETVSEADSVVQTHSNVAFGYLSILLCTLCIEREAYDLVKDAMNGAGLEELLATVEEFLHYHRKVDEELHQSQSLKEFTAKLQKILNQIRAIEGA